MNNLAVELVSDVFFFRCPEAKKGGEDSLRELTSRGVEEANRVRRDFGNRTHGIITSPAVRCTRMAEIVCPEVPDLMTAPLLYRPEYPEDQTSFLELFSELGHAPLLKYLERDRAGTLARWSVMAALEILSRLSLMEWSKTIVIGHGIILPAIGARLCPKKEAVFKNLVLSTAQGFKLGPDDHLELL
ncbi:MAG: hypothetical protein V1821_01860 [bacterium]